MTGSTRAIHGLRAAYTGTAAAAVLLTATACAGNDIADGAAPRQAPDIAVTTSASAAAPTSTVSAATADPSSTVPTGAAGAFAPAGVVVTDTAYVPTIAPSGSADPSQSIGHPALQNLPAGWDPADWITRVAAVTGDSSPTTQAGYQGVNETWNEASSSPSLELGVTAGQGPDAGEVTALQCFARGFEAADDNEAAQATALLTLCGAADFPGGDPARAEVWIRDQVGYLLHDLATMHPGDHVSCATPIFGSGVYVMSAQLNSPDASTILVGVYGSAT